MYHAHIVLTWIGFYDASIFDPMIQIKYVNTTQRLADILTKASFTRDRWTQLTLLVNIMNHTTLTKSNLSISSGVVNPSFSSMSKRARDCFRNIGKRESKASSLHSDVCVNISEKNANVGCHAVLPPEYQAGGDSKREDLCWPDSLQLRFRELELALELFAIHVQRHHYLR